MPQKAPYRWATGSLLPLLERRWTTLFCHEEPPHTCRDGLPSVNQSGYHRHYSLPPAAAEMYEAKAATQHNLHWPNKGFWSGQQGRSLQDWMSTQAPSQYHILPRRPSKKTSKKWCLTIQHKIPSTSKVDKQGYILHSEVPAGVPVCRWCPCFHVSWFDNLRSNSKKTKIPAPVWTSDGRTKCKTTTCWRAQESLAYTPC